MENNIVLHLKGMICDRCTLLLMEKFVNHNISFKKIELGFIEFNFIPNEHDFSIIEQIISELGFSFIKDNPFIIYHRAKIFVEKYFTEGIEFRSLMKINKYVISNLNTNISDLNKIFFYYEGCSFEKYVLDKKLKHISRQLTHTDYSLSEIAFQFGYSSIHHLSNQFKTEMGVNPSYFRQVNR